MHLFASYETAASKSSRFPRPDLSKTAGQNCRGVRQPTRAPLVSIVDNTQDRMLSHVLTFLRANPLGGTPHVRALRWATPLAPLRPRTLIALALLAKVRNKWPEPESTDCVDSYAWQDRQVCDA